MGKPGLGPLKAERTMGEYSAWGAREKRGQKKDLTDVGERVTDKSLLKLNVLKCCSILTVILVVLVLLYDIHKMNMRTYIMNLRCLKKKLSR